MNTETQRFPKNFIINEYKQAQKLLPYSFFQFDNSHKSSLNIGEIEIILHWTGNATKVLINKEKWLRTIRRYFIQKFQIRNLL